MPAQREMESNIAGAIADVTDSDEEVVGRRGMRQSWTGKIGVMSRSQEPEMSILLLVRCLP